MAKNTKYLSINLKKKDMEVLCVKYRTLLRDFKNYVRGLKRSKPGIHTIWSSWIHIKIETA